MKIEIFNAKNRYDYEELIKLFLRPSEYEICLSGEGERAEDKNAVKRELYDMLSEKTGRRPPWGILTGVRPVKLAGELYDRLGSYDEVLKLLKSEYYLREDKAKLITEIYAYQQERLGKAPENEASVYAGIPFCPTRCLYCSFASNQKDYSEIKRYLKALIAEAEYTGERFISSGRKAESLYIGGGTPTTLKAEDLEELIILLREKFGLDKDKALKEFTVEAGRPDTVSRDRLRVLREQGVSRISINPQTVNDKTLELIGRSHTYEDFLRAFVLARKAGFTDINCDLICGLPEEGLSDFAASLDKMIELEAENITVHTLAVKRASRLHEEDEDYHYRQGGIVSDMLYLAEDRLRAAGYRPYYLYRQKHMAGALENIGWCRNNKIGVYNIRIMEEKQTIVAMGAGGISKRFYPAENRLERVPNVSNYEIYIERLGEMLERKEKGLFA